MVSVDGSFALVRLTWSGHQEGLPYPRVTATGPYAEYDDAYRLTPLGMASRPDVPLGADLGRAS